MIHFIHNEKKYCKIRKKDIKLNRNYYVLLKGGFDMAEKTDIQTARRNLRSPNIKTRKRALKIIKSFKRAARIKNIQNNAAS